MKLVKLNRRHNAYKNHGHQWAFRFTGWSEKAAKVENLFFTLHGSKYNWMRGRGDGAGVWYSHFGKLSSSYSQKPFWITFTDEHDASFVLMQLS